MAIPPYLAKLGVKFIASHLGKKLLKSGVENGSRRLAKIANSLLPSDSPYLKGRDNAATSLPMSAMYALLHSTLLKPNEDRTYGCVKNPAKVVPFDIKKTIEETLKENLGENAEEKYSAVFNALNKTPFGQAIPTDVRDALNDMSKKVASNPNQQNLCSTVLRGISSHVASSIAGRQETTLSPQELDEMERYRKQFEDMSQTPAYQRGAMKMKPDLSQ
ncbi:hypothetical protein HB762_26830 (plasmid) [Vibrio campbellii]|uniref:Uncharacterized protein n=1 Tax=Vibrio campbellii TaxID=680 RepID=A0ABY5IL37_9VIBR|nr:hypothetical protein [Vibrio campbellii]UTZ34879.1 hypothetical protein HB762_26830 [Vibrio campbellii]